MKIGTKIRNLRVDRKMSQRELSLEIGIEQTTLANIESCKSKKVDFLLIDKICNFFDVGFDYFLETKKEKFTLKNNENNNIVVGKIEVLNNAMPEGIIENILKRLEKLEQNNQ